ncbi:MAG: MCE family protein [Solirubrobacterales bacterium]|nr:MCE family protein [Solirubrobacterales bacterium]
MKHAIKTHMKDFIAIAALILIALMTLLVILANQKAALPSWVPGLGQDFYSINAQFPTAQAVTPGQGQAAVIAGINVGKLGAASIDDGVAKVRIDIDPKYKDLIHSDAEFLLRPKTGLNDMVVEIDPGSEGPPPEEGATLPLAQGLSNVQLEEFFGTLDKDTQDYIVLLLDGAGEGLAGNGRNLSKTLRRFGPFAEYTARINGALAKRRENIKNGVHAFSQIATELGNNDQAVADFVTNSKDSLGNFAAEEASLRQALQEFPSTLTAAQNGLNKSNRFTVAARPTLLKLIPGAKNLKSSLIQLQDLAIETTPTIRDNIRPFTRDTQPVFADLSNSSKDLKVTSEKTTAVLTELNQLFDLLAHNPDGDQEGFLFWAPWANHNLNSALNGQDAMGPVRRALGMVTCITALRAKQLQDDIPQLPTSYNLAQLPPPTPPAQGGICP